MNVPLNGRSVDDAEAEQPNSLFFELWEWDTNPH
jgi:hypothetical protein